MCGRYVMARSTGDLVAALGVDRVAGEDVPPSWNIAPTQKVRIVTGRGPEGAGPGRGLETARWGLVPVWAKSRSVGVRAINARSETVLEKPTFRSAAVKRRALVPADGYYEWSGEKGAKIPTYLHGQDGEPLAFAGLYEFWRDPEVPEGEPDAWLMTTTVLTRPATDALGHIHDRTPVIVPPGLRDGWLDPGLTDRSRIQQLIDAIPDPSLLPHRVGPAVGNVRNDGPELIAPVAEGGGAADDDGAAGDGALFY
ncbi:SOS response-associated peptidase [Zhihengliuella sp.]|uniref:SOS response-associated peptidase n=1 Tax=Zhihengliuella sp. TaxID=1954483 RepID=UPI002811F1AB|nr:SOS response-associated peptidase [Zhihengliuella sp.]